MTRQLYFAYGSNMNHMQMRHRCPLAKIVGPARLPGWGLRERIYADIAKSRNEAVPGLLWSITSHCELALDCYEGVACGLYEKVSVVVSKRDERVRALVYVMTPHAVLRRDGCEFSDSYRETCLQGAVCNGVPIHALYMSREAVSA